MNTEMQPRYFLGDLTEVENLSRFDAKIAGSKMFRSYSEVEGSYLHSLPGEAMKKCRIDRVLSPTNLALASGWTLGPVGIEAKAGNLAIGKGLAQAMDYRRAAFRMNGGYDVILRWIFIYPAQKQSGPLESVMAQHGVGSCFWGYHDELILWANGRQIAQIGNEQEVGKMPVSGNKRGSR